MVARKSTEGAEPVVHAQGIVVGRTGFPKSASVVPCPFVHFHVSRPCMVCVPMPIWSRDARVTVGVLQSVIGKVAHPEQVTVAHEVLQHAPGLPFLRRDTPRRSRRGHCRIRR